MEDQLDKKKIFFSEFEFEIFGWISSLLNGEKRITNNSERPVIRNRDPIKPQTSEKFLPGFWIWKLKSSILTLSVSWNTETELSENCGQQVHPIHNCDWSRHCGGRWWNQTTHLKRVWLVNHITEKCAMSNPQILSLRLRLKTPIHKLILWKNL